MSTSELVALVCCDLGAIVRGRSVFADELDEHLRSGVGWVPANHALTPLGPVAEPNPFGSTGDLRLLPDAETRARVSPDGEHSALELVLCDIVQTDGRPWECCPRSFLRDALLELERERFFAEYAPSQFEIPLAAAEGIASADRSVLLREVVREIARRQGMRASFAPLLDPQQAGNGVHVHLNLVDAAGSSLLYDATRPACLSELGERFENPWDAKVKIFDYIEVFYNQQRMHTSIGYMSPAEFERAPVIQVAA